MHWLSSKHNVVLAVRLLANVNYFVAVQNRLLRGASTCLPCVILCWVCLMLQH